VNIELYEIKASTEAISRFFYDCNTNAEIRAEFLEHPIRILAREPYGIEVSKQVAKEIIEYRDKFVKEIGEDVGEPPVGWEDHRWELMDEGLGIRIKGSDRGVIL